MVYFAKGKSDTFYTNAEMFVGAFDLAQCLGTWRSERLEMCFDKSSEALGRENHLIPVIDTGGGLEVRAVP